MCHPLINSQLTDLIQSVVGVFSIILALIAIIATWSIEKRTKDRFQNEQDLNKKIAEANAKPILSVWTTEYKKHKGITLINCGTGTAIITKIEFSKGSESEKNIAKLFKKSKNFLWDTCWTFSDTKFYIQAGKEIVLVKLTLKGLEEQNFSNEEALLILEEWQSNMEGIRILITYDNVFDNQQPLYERILHS
jgi:hypothetical protein